MGGPYGQDMEFVLVICLGIGVMLGGWLLGQMVSVLIDLIRR